MATTIDSAPPATGRLWPAGGLVAMAVPAAVRAEAPRMSAAVDLYWLPLGAGGHSVRVNGRIFEAVAARAGHRTACDLYHSALEVRVPDGRYVIEMTPVRDGSGAARGVAVQGPVGSRRAGGWRLF